MRPLDIAFLAVAVGMPNAVATLVLSSQGDVHPSLAQTPPAADAWTHARLTPDQGWLLESSYQAASAFPLNPHIKNRSRAQEAVVVAAFELDQPIVARRYAEGIANWRRASGIADVAQYAAEHNLDVSVQELIDEAFEAISTHDTGKDQEWRKERVLAKLENTKALLSGGGQIDYAALSDEEFEAELAALDRLVLAGSFDQVQAVLHTLSRAYSDVYSQPKRREAIEAKIGACEGKLPRLIHIEVAYSLTETALRHGDSEHALELLRGIGRLMAGATWLIEDKLPLLARMAALRFEAGEVALARKEAKALRLTYEAERDTIVDINRADVLRSLAEGLAKMQDPDQALEVYTQALEEGVINPNSRPRADDTIATCLSMAVHEVKLSASLRERINAICRALNHPW